MDDSTPAPIRVTGFDHLVLKVADVERSLEFYCRVLGLEPVRLEEWRSGAAPFASVRIDAATIIDLVPGGRGTGPDAENVDHFCLVIDGDLDDLVASGRFDVEFGPADLFGARGTGRGVYVRDPDGNGVELRTYATG